MKENNNYYIKNDESVLDLECKKRNLRWCNLWYCDRY